MIIPKGWPGSHPNPAKRGGVFGEYPALGQVRGVTKKICGKNLAWLNLVISLITTSNYYYRYHQRINLYFSSIMIGKLNSGQNL